MFVILDENLALLPNVLPNEFGVRNKTILLKFNSFYFTKITFILMRQNNMAGFLTSWSD